MNHNKNTMIEFGQPIKVKGIIKRYADGTIRRHGLTKDNKPKKVRSDKQTDKPTQTGNI